MPIPNPHKDESKQDFISRCMGDSVMKLEYGNTDQRFAICSSEWRLKTHSIGSVYNINGVLNNYVTQMKMFEGVEHLVVPVVLITEGVHEGSGGPKYYSSEELSKFTGAWDGIPVTLRHPVSSEGAPISANSPEVIENQMIGRLWNVEFKDLKLVGEVWINTQKAKRLAPDVLKTLKTRRPLEVSTGLWSDEEYISGEWNGEVYDAIVRNIRPDHLALLPDEQGACSWDDGCGIRANNLSAEEQTIVREYGKKMSSRDWIDAYDEENNPHWAEETSPSPLADELLNDLNRKGIMPANILEIGIGNGRDSIYFAEKGHFVFGIDISSKAVEEAKKKIAHMDNIQFAVGDAEHLEFSDGSFDAVYTIAALHSTPLRFVLKEINRVLKVSGIAKLFLYTRTRLGDSNWISYWTPGEIKQYAEEEGYTIEKFREVRDNQPIKIPGIQEPINQETHIVITTIKKKEGDVMNANIKSTAGAPSYSGTGVIEKAKNLLGKITNIFNTIDVNETSHKEVRSMLQKELDTLDNQEIQPPILHYVRAVYDDYFVFEKTGPDGEKLFKQIYSIDSDGKLQLGQEVKEVRQEVQYVELSTANQNNNKEAEMNDEKEKCCPEKVKALIANEATAFSEEDKDWLEALTAEQLEKLEPKILSGDGDADSTTENKQNNESTDKDTSATQNNQQNDEEKSPLSFEEILANASPEHREMIQDGLRLFKEKKSTLVKSLLSNKRNKFTEEKLMNMKIEDLEALTELAQVKVDFSLKGGTTVQNTQEESLELPVMEWSKS